MPLLSNGVSRARGNGFMLVRCTVVAAAVAIAVWLLPRESSACGSCRGPGGPGASVTAPWQTWGVQLVSTVRVSQGFFLEDSRYTSSPSGSLDASHDLGVALGFRIKERLELQASIGVGYTTLALHGYARSGTGFADTFLRVRYDIVSEPGIVLPSKTPPPSLAATLSLRAPTGFEGRGAQGGVQATVGSQATSQTLGTTELALALDIRKTLKTKYQVAAVVEGALRVPDHSLGQQRTLGPRVLGRVVAIWFASDNVTASVFVDAGVEGRIAYEGVPSTQTSAHLWTTGASLSFKHDKGLRTGVAFSYNAPIDTLGSNVAANMLFSSFVGFAK